MNDRIQPNEMCALYALRIEARKQGALDIEKELAVLSRAAASCHGYQDEISEFMPSAPQTENIKVHVMHEGKMSETPELAAWDTK